MLTRSCFDVSHGDTVGVLPHNKKVAGLIPGPGAFLVLVGLVGVASLWVLGLPPAVQREKLQQAPITPSTGGGR